ncbi:MAG: dihydropteroate synthase [Agarilytica sp.]
MPFAPRNLDLSQAQVMGILNVTPDSFFDGGRYIPQGKNVDSALNQAEKMCTEGASIIDVGGESTRPGAAAVSQQEEMDRVLPVVEAIARSLDVVISVDTSTPALMREAAMIGAGFINDVRALQREGAAETAAETGLPVCLMHMQGQPCSMQTKPNYSDLIGEVRDFFAERIAACETAGIPASRIVLDPGFGFGKSDAHNLTLLKHMRELHPDLPLLAGLSRKSIIGRLLNRNEDERLAGSLALAQYALQYGAVILRVHDVAETVDIVKLYHEIQK